MTLINKAGLLSPTLRQRVMLHLLFWSLLFAVRFYLTLITFNVYSGIPASSALTLNLFSTFLIACFYYILTGPVWTLIRSGKRLFAAALLIMSVVFYVMTDALLEHYVLFRCDECLAIMKRQQSSYYELLQSGFINIVLKRLLSLGPAFFLLLTSTIPLCLKLTLNSWRSQVKALELARHNVELEFNFLKAQINPHFLFNTLNNIYGLILREDTGKSAELVARLSALLRYTLYETDESHIPLAKEIKLLTDYIELEKVRLNEATITSSISADLPDRHIPPLLLLPLVENAFKFCSDDQNAYIHLSMDEFQGRLRFTLDNTVDPGRLPAGKEGIGLVNFRKRLDLYYPGRYSYEAGFKNGIYSVLLSIDLL